MAHGQTQTLDPGPDPDIAANPTFSLKAAGAGTVYCDGDGRFQMHHVSEISLYYVCNYCMNSIGFSYCSMVMYVLEDALFSVSEVFI